MNIIVEKTEVIAQTTKGVEVIAETTSGIEYAVTLQTVGLQGVKGKDGDGVAYYGQIFSQTSQEVTITTAGEFVPMAIDGTFDTEISNGTVESITNPFGIRNTSGEKQLFTVIASADVGIGNNRTAGLRLAVNGVSLPETTCTATTGVQNFAKLMSHYIVELDVNDELTCAIANFTTTDDINVLRSKIVMFTAGRQGEQGIQGIQGDKGDKGDQGDDGPNDIGGFPILITNIQEKDILQFNSEAWRNKPQEALTDGGNF